MGCPPYSDMTDPRKALSAVVRKQFETACRDFRTRIAVLGFRQTKRALWTRLHARTIDVIAFRRSGSSYGAPINAELHIEVSFWMWRRNDGPPTAVLAGPNSNPGRARAGRYHLRFNARSGSMYDRCLDDLHRFVVEQGEPWFQKLAGVVDFDEPATSDLTADEREFLRAVSAGEGDAEQRAASLKASGSKNE